jgi:hypothetical protein
LSPQGSQEIGVESTKLVDIPRIADVFAFKGPEAVGAWSGHLGNCEGTFPWRAELVPSFRVLDAAKDEIANVEGAFLDVVVMVASDTLKVPC